MKCGDCENYKAKEPKVPTWTGTERVTWAATYSNDGTCGPDDEDWPRLKHIIRGFNNDNGRRQTRAGFLTPEDAELFLAALPEEER